MYLPMDRTEVFMQLLSLATEVIKFLAQQRKSEAVERRWNISMFPARQNRSAGSQARFVFALGDASYLEEVRIVSFKAWNEAVCYETAIWHSQLGS